MAEHVRITRNRREFLTDAFCGFGALAYASMLHAARSRGRIRWRRSRRTFRQRRSRSSSCSWRAARAIWRRSIPSRC